MNGFDIPRTLITNDPAAARDFYHVCHGNIILKALHHHSVECQGKLFSMYTHRVEKKDLSKFNELIYAPCILQERIHKQSELRVTVVGGRVFAAKIACQSTNNSLEDFHRCAISDLPIKAIKLENSIIEGCIKIVNSLRLRYGAIDFVVDKRSRLIFLEINPTGDWYWIERQTGLPITEAMVDLIEEEYGRSSN
jgi:glutathione synthase/RimK-type ligase-like ATP-grasp enzyme